MDLRLPGKKGRTNIFIFFAFYLAFWSVMLFGIRPFQSLGLIIHLHIHILLGLLPFGLTLRWPSKVRPNLTTRGLNSYSNVIFDGAL